MKRQPLLLVALLALSFVLAACTGGGTGGAPGGQGGNGAGTGVEPSLSVTEMVDKMLEAVEQPMFMVLDEDTLADFFELDLDLVDEYSIRVPMMNVSSSEISLIKVKDEANIPAIEEAMAKRALVAQMAFESYLPDQYENAKNYSITVNGKYVLFVISGEADELKEQFASFFAAP